MLNRFDDQWGFELVVKIMLENLIPLIAGGLAKQLEIGIAPNTTETKN